MDFQKYIIQGRTTGEPTAKTTDTLTISNFTVAINSKQGSGDNAKTEVLFMPVVVFGKQAESCNQYLVKGQEVLIEGRLKENKWEDKDQQKRSRIELIADKVRFGRKPNASGQGDQAPEGIDDSEPF